MREHIRKYKFKEGFKHEVEVLSLEKLHVEHPEMISQPHRANFYHVFWFQKGTATHTVDFTPIPISGNTLLFVNKEQVQQFHLSKKVVGKVLVFTDNFFSKSEYDLMFLKNSILFNDFLDTATIPLSTRAKLLIPLFENIEQELVRENDEYSYDIMQNMLHNFLMRCERIRKTTGFTEIEKSIELTHTVQFKKLLDEWYKEEKSVSGYAIQMNMSTKRLTQSTQKALGKTPKEIITDRVILEAKRLLVHAPITIKEVGYEIGFDEPTNFIKYFKKYTGQTPIEFKK